MYHSKLKQICQLFIPSKVEFLYLQGMQAQQRGKVQPEEGNPQKAKGGRWKEPKRTLWQVHGQGGKVGGKSGKRESMALSVKLISLDKMDEKSPLKIKNENKPQKVTNTGRSTYTGEAKKHKSSVGLEAEGQSIISLAACLPWHRHQTVKQ